MFRHPRMLFLPHSTGQRKSQGQVGAGRESPPIGGGLHSALAVVITPKCWMDPADYQTGYVQGIAKTHCKWYDHKGVYIIH